jgi:hypothetical protein
MFPIGINVIRILFLTLRVLVFESPVWSGYFAHLALTETETG